MDHTAFRFRDSEVEELSNLLDEAVIFTYRDQLSTLLARLLNAGMVVEEPVGREIACYFLTPEAKEALGKALGA
jgi:hypothetical protein